MPGKGATINKALVAISNAGTKTVRVTASYMPINGWNIDQQRDVFLTHSMRVQVTKVGHGPTYTHQYKTDDFNLSWLRKIFLDVKKKVAEAEEAKPEPPPPPPRPQKTKKSKTLPTAPPPEAEDVDLEDPDLWD